jgi:hypothetical protein
MGILDVATLTVDAHIAIEGRATIGKTILFPDQAIPASG